MMWCRAVDVRHVSQARGGSHVGYKSVTCARGVDVRHMSQTQVAHMSVTCARGVDVRHVSRARGGSHVGYMP